MPGAPADDCGTEQGRRDSVGLGYVGHSTVQLSEVERPITCGVAGLGVEGEESPSTTGARQRPREGVEAAGVGVVRSSVNPADAGWANQRARPGRAVYLPER